MEDKLRKSGLDIIGDASWGTHCCYFYQTKKDLTDILVPYFKVGLENNEFCIWVTSEPLDAKEAQKAIRKAVPDFGLYLKKGQIEILPYDSWFLKDGVLDLSRVLNNWVDKLNRALSKGYDGMRVSGNTAWLEKSNWQSFAEYEEEINRAIGGHRMIALCTYSLGMCGAPDIIDVVSNHQFALIKRNSKWVVIESAEQLRVEAAQRESERMFRLISENSRDVICLHDSSHKYVYISLACKEILGYDPEELVGTNPWRLVHPQDMETLGKVGLEKAEKGGSVLFSYRIRKKSGDYIWFESVSRLLKDDKGSPLGFVTSSRDITERKQTEEMLKKSEENYRELAESINDVFFAMNDELRCTYWNRASEKLTGVAAKDALGKHLCDIFPDVEETKRVEKEYLKAIRTKQTQNFVSEYRLGDKDFVFNISAYPIKSGISVFVKDITEFKRVEKVLRESKERFRNLADLLPQTICETNIEGKITFVNSNAFNMFGYSPPDLDAGLTIWQMIAPADQNKARDNIQRVLMGEDSGGIEYTAQRKDGSTFPVLVYTSSVFRKHEPVGLKMIIVDITERKWSERALKESEQLYSSLFKYNPDAVYAINLNGKFISVNDSTCRISGYSAKEFFNMTFDPLIISEDRERVRQHFNKAQAGETQYYDTTIINKDGQWVNLDVTNIPIIIDNKIVGIFGIAKDITKRVKMQEQLIIQDRLASIGELASGIAHEINNPLTGIIGLSEIVLDADVPAEVKEDMKTINSEAQRTARIVHNLLTFARKQPQEKQPINVNDAITKVLEMRAYEQKVSNINVITHFAPDLPEIIGNSFHLQQVFINIIMNAEYFMIEAHGKGTLTINTKQAGNFVRISIVDDGPGITKETLRHIFDPFFTTKEVGKGTGLGLSLCHGIVIEHGGRIYAESEVGKGATFIIELPITSAESKRAGK